jgi:hypothetical protein
VKKLLLVLVLVALGVLIAKKVRSAYIEAGYLFGAAGVARRRIQR